MIAPTFATTPTMPNLECDAAMSDAVLQAARAAMPANPAMHYLLPQAVEQLAIKQQPLIPLLMALLDAAQSTAKAIADNAWDDSLPLAQSLADELAKQCRAIADDITNATQCPDATSWSLSSMTGKELV